MLANTGAFAAALGVGLSGPENAYAQADCMSDCLKNCKKIAPKVSFNKGMHAQWYQKIFPL